MKKKLLIIGTLPPPYSGYETATETLLEAKFETHFKVYFLSSKTAEKPSTRGELSFNNVIQTLKILMKVFKTMLIIRPDIVNLPLAQNKIGYLKWFAIASTCKIFRPKIVSRLGGDSFHIFYANSPTWLKKTIHFGLSMISIIIVRSPSLTAQFNGLFPQRNIVVVPNGFNLRKWQKTLPPKISKDKISVLFLGTVSKAKGALDFINAIHILKIKNQLSHFTFTIAGPIIERELNLVHLDSNNNNRTHIQTLIKNCELENIIQIIPPVGYEEKQCLLSSADVLVMPSHAEGGFPYVILEAIASECAIICTPLTPVTDYISHNKEAIIVPKSSPNQIAEALLELEKLPQHRKKLTQNALTYLTKNHDLTTFKKSMRTVFNRALYS